jgi:hypothetical protein
VCTGTVRLEHLHLAASHGLTEGFGEADQDN